MEYSSNYPIPSNTRIRLTKLWPHARSQGKELGQVWRIGEYSEADGTDVIWLVDSNDEYVWTIDHEFLHAHFIVERNQ